jgi:hypothetical protein
VAAIRRYHGTFLLMATLIGTQNFQKHIRDRTHNPSCHVNLLQTRAPKTANVHQARARWPSLSSFTRYGYWLQAGAVPTGQLVTHIASACSNIAPCARMRCPPDQTSLLAAHSPPAAVQLSTRRSLIWVCRESADLTHPATLAIHPPLPPRPALQRLHTRHPGRPASRPSCRCPAQLPGVPRLCCNLSAARCRDCLPLGSGAATADVRRTRCPSRCIPRAGGLAGGCRAAGSTGGMRH